ncbi:hypothetical protein [Arthrobacter sp. NA-172]
MPPAPILGYEIGNAGRRSVHMAGAWHNVHVGHPDGYTQHAGL